MYFEERKREIKTVVNYAITLGILELNECNGIAIHYENGNIMEQHIDDFINDLVYNKDNYSKMCEELLYLIANTNLKKHERNKDYKENEK